jgi:hypothetical protein
VLITNVLIRKPGGPPRDCGHLKFGQVSYITHVSYVFAMLTNRVLATPDKENVLMKKAWNFSDGPVSENCGCIVLAPSSFSGVAQGSKVFETPENEI